MQIRPPFQQHPNDIGVAREAAPAGQVQRGIPVPVARAQVAARVQEGPQVLHRTALRGSMDRSLLIIEAADWHVRADSLGQQLLHEAVILVVGGQVEEAGFLDGDRRSLAGGQHQDHDPENGKSWHSERSCHVVHLLFMLKGC